MKELTEYDELVLECAQRGIALARKMANDGTLEPLYLYARQSVPGHGPGRLFLLRDSAPIPPGVVLVTGEGLRGNVPYKGYFSWIADRAMSARILAIPCPTCGANHSQEPHCLGCSLVTA